MKYELTITLKPLMYRMSAKEQFNLTSTVLLEIMKPYKCSIVAELTQEHNVHYHCLVELADIKEKEKLMNRFRPHNKMFGKKTCTQVQFEESYRKYMVKTVEEIRPILGDVVLRDYFSVAKTIFE